MQSAGRRYGSSGTRTATGLSSSPSASRRRAGSSSWPARTGGGSRRPPVRTSSAPRCGPRDLLEQELRAACAGDLGIVAEALDWAYGR